MAAAGLYGGGSKQIFIAWYFRKLQTSRNFIKMSELIATEKYYQCVLYLNYT